MERIGIVDDSRQQLMIDELGINTHRDVHVIIGCGGIGYWLGIMLAMMQGRYIVLMDGDKIDATNLSRLPVPQTWIGQNKAVALRKTIKTLRPDTVVTCLTTHITDDTLSLLQEVSEKAFPAGERAYYTGSHISRRLCIWDTTDDARIQQKISGYVDEMKNKATRSHSVSYRKMGYDGFKVGSYKDMNTWKLPDDYQAGYRTTNANAISSAIAAGLGVFGMYLNADDLNIDLKETLTGRTHDDMDERGNSTGS